MTLNEIRTLLTGADEYITHHFSVQSGRDYSYWEESQQLAFTTDDRHDEAWRFYVHRFTRDEYDPVAERLFGALDEDPRVTVIRSKDFERETGYIHHIFQCEGY